MTHSGHAQEYFHRNSNSRAFTTTEFVEDKSRLLKIVKQIQQFQSRFQRFLTVFYPDFKKHILNVITYLQYIALV
jgi:hypothetical protein